MAANPTNAANSTNSSLTLSLLQLSDQIFLPLIRPHSQEWCCELCADCGSRLALPAPAGSSSLVVVVVVAAFAVSVAATVVVIGVAVFSRLAG